MSKKGKRSRSSAPSAAPNRLASLTPSVTGTGTGSLAGTALPPVVAKTAAAQPTARTAQPAPEVDASDAPDSARAPVSESGISRATAGGHASTRADEAPLKLPAHAPLPADLQPGGVAAKPNAKTRAAASSSDESTVGPDAEAFFNSMPVLPIDPSDLSDLDTDNEERASLRARRMAGVVTERRARNTKYVQYALIACGLLVAAGGLRVLLRPAAAVVVVPSGSTATGETAAVGLPSGEAPVTTVAPAASTASAAAELPFAAVADLDAATADAQAALVAADAAIEASAESNDEALSDAERLKLAGTAARDAQRALDQGRAAAAITAGERATKLDPTNGDAWLVLGAAYQERGNMGEARRCFAACVKQGKRGAIGDCAQMLRH